MDLENAWVRGLFYNLPTTERTDYDKRFGWSVRCVEGQGYSVPTVTTSEQINVTDN